MIDLIEQKNVEIAEFCRKWQIQELSLFGSILRDDFRPDSDIDILVRFLPEADWSLLDHVRAENELAAILGRKIDLVSRRAVERSSNWIRKKHILESTRVIYAA